MCFVVVAGTQYLTNAGWGFGRACDAGRGLGELDDTGTCCVAGFEAVSGAFGPAKGVDRVDGGFSFGLAHK